VLLLASSAALPRPPRGRPHPAHEGYVNPPVNPYVNPPVNPPAPDGVPDLAFAIGIIAGKRPCVGPVARKNRGRLAPLGGEVRARLIHSSAVRLYGAAFGGDRFIQPTGCRMERSQFSAHLRRAAAIRRRLITIMRWSGTTDRHSL
jgi:hypothetical protein